MLNQRRFVVGAVLIAAAVGWLVYAGIRSTSMYYFNMEDFVGIKAQHTGEDLRVHGWVRSGSMKWDPQTNRLDFDIAQKDGATPIPVFFTGVLPDMFAEGREVVVEARWDGTTLGAKQVMTACPSKYEAKKDGTAPSS